MQLRRLEQKGEPQKSLNPVNSILSIPNATKKRGTPSKKKRKIRRRKLKVSMKSVRRIYSRLLQQVGLKAMITPIYDSAAARYSNLVQAFFGSNLQDDPNRTLIERRLLGVKPV